MEKNSKKNEKAFTLIELLAVIVILAIIALIAVPMIMKILNQSRKSAAEDSTYGVAETVNAYIAETMLANGTDFPTETLVFECNNTSCELNSETKTILDNAGIQYKETLDIKGKKPTAGTITISNGGHTIKASGLKFGNFICSYDGEKADCGGSNSNSNTTVGSFATDSWDVIAENARNGNTSNYHVGDTKIIKMDIDGNGTPEKYSVRIVNMSTPDECSRVGFSQTACGFVVEFGGSQTAPKDSNGNIITKRILNSKTYLEAATSTSTSTSTNTSTNTSTSSEIKDVNDIIISYHMNSYISSYPYGYNMGGWEKSDLREYIQNDIYNLLPSDLKNVIIDTAVVSGHGSSDNYNHVTKDKLYLLSPKEIGIKNSYDTSNSLTRTLDFYATNNDSSARIKKFDNSNEYWWLRSAFSEISYSFYGINDEGIEKNFSSHSVNGVAPVFRIGGPDVSQFGPIATSTISY